MGAREPREVEGWRDIAAAVGRALGRSVSVPTAMRYEQVTWPWAEDPHPLRVGWRGNGVRFLRLDTVFEAWVAWFGNRPARARPRRQAGDRRR